MRWWPYFSMFTLQMVTGSFMWGVIGVIIRYPCSSCCSVLVGTGGRSLQWWVFGKCHVGPYLPLWQTEGHHLLENKSIPSTGCDLRYSGQCKVHLQGQYLENEIQMESVNYRFVSQLTISSNWVQQPQYHENLSLKVVAGMILQYLALQSMDCWTLQARVSTSSISIQAIGRTPTLSQVRSCRRQDCFSSDDLVLSINGEPEVRLLIVPKNPSDGILLPFGVFPVPVLDLESISNSFFKNFLHRFRLLKSNEDFRN